MGKERNDEVGGHVDEQLEEEDGRKELVQAPEVRFLFAILFEPHLHAVAHPVVRT
jgi:hypothetical protein